MKYRRRRVEKTYFICICGCNRGRFGNKGAKHYEPYCRLVAHLARKKALVAA